MNTIRFGNTTGKIFGPLPELNDIAVHAKALLNEIRQPLTQSTIRTQ